MKVFQKCKKKHNIVLNHKNIHSCIILLIVNTCKHKNYSYASLFLLAYRPVLVSGNTNYSTDSYYVGTNVCILPNRPRELVLTCTHDTSFPTTAAPPMIATWIFNGGNPNIINTYYESNDIVSNANLIIETFRVTEFSQLLGEYTCVLENSAGNDNATTRVTKCCESKLHRDIYFYSVYSKMTNLIP